MHAGQLKKQYVNQSMRLIAAICLLLPFHASAVVQFQAEPRDIPAVRGATVQFITVEGDGAEVEVDRNGVLVLSGVDDLDLVRGGVLTVRPTNGTPAFSAAVPMQWDGVTPLVLDMATQSLVVRPDVPLRQPSTDADDQPPHLQINDNPLYYMGLRLNEIHELAISLGIPAYALDADVDTIQRWYTQLLLRAHAVMLALHPAEIERTFVIHELLFGVLALTAPPVAQEGLNADECRVVSDEEPVGEGPLAITRITAEDLALSGRVFSSTGRPLTNTRILFSPTFNPYASQQAFWTEADALPPSVGFPQADGSFQLRVPEMALVGPQGTPFGRTTIRFPTRQEPDRPTVGAEVAAMIEALVAEGCFQAPPVLFGADYLPIR